MCEMMFLAIAAHFVCDYTFQTEAIALGKNRAIDKARFGVNWWYWMSAHAFTHGLAFYFITGSVMVAVADTFAHFVIDDSKCTGLIGIHEDQIAHLVWRIIVVIMFTL